MAQMNRNVNLEEINSDALFGIDALKNQTIFQKIIFFGCVIGGVLVNVLLPIFYGTTTFACVLMFLGLLLIGIAFGCNYTEDMTYGRYMYYFFFKPTKPLYFESTEDVIVIREKAKELKREEELLLRQKQQADPKAQKRLLIMLVSFVLVLAIAIGAVFMYSNKKDKTKVVVMKESVVQNTLIKGDELDEYFEEMSVELTAVPELAYRSVKDLPTDGLYVENAMGKSQMVLKYDIAKTDEVMDKYLNGYQVTSFASESFPGGVNGSLRKGDIVNVYALDPATELLILMAEKVYVAEVYDNAGNKVTEPDGIATSFTIYVTDEEVEQINLAVVYGGVQMYLVEK